jgi:ComF family protein
VNLKEWGNDLLDFCYPPRCARCDGSASRGAMLCTGCESEMHNLERRPACERCARPIGGPGGACPYCEGDGLRPYDRIASLGLFRDPLRPLIHDVKYHRQWTLAERLADRLWAQRGVRELVERSDCIAPVPLHRFRQMARGFNQAEVIARCLKKKARKPLVRPAVRLRNTESQTRVTSRTKREENLKDAFGLITDRPIRGRRVLVVDDVMTTGATLQSFAKTLRFAEPHSLSAVVLAVADPLGQDFEVI